jgi:hypothetical protein
MALTDRDGRILPNTKRLMAEPLHFRWIICCGYFMRRTDCLFIARWSMITRTSLDTHTSSHAARFGCGMDQGKLPGMTHARTSIRRDLSKQAESARLAMCALHRSQRQFQTIGCHRCALSQSPQSPARCSCSLRRHRHPGNRQGRPQACRACLRACRHPHRPGRRTSS